MTVSNGEHQMETTISWTERLGSMGDTSTCSEEERLKHRFLVYLGVLMSIGGLIWGTLSVVFGITVQASIPYGYAVGTVLNFSYFRASKNFETVRFIQVLMSLMLPFLFQWSLGGFAISGGVMLWAMLALVGSLTFSESSSVLRWLVIYLGLTIFSGAIDAAVGERFLVDVTPGVQTLFFVLNIAFISSVVFGLTLYMLLEREKASEARLALTRKNEELEEEISKARRMGSYHLNEKLGEGGMGEVWSAEHVMLARPAAVKLIQPKMLGAEGDANQALARFEREAQATASLRSPHTVNLYDFGRSDDGAFYYVMELLDGLDLEEMVRTYGPLPVERAAFLLAQVCDSLGEAHALGLVHRDIKPANIFVGCYGHRYDHVSVLDFGLVRTFEGAVDTTKLTGKGVMACTPAYAAPEIHTAPEALDGRTDLYSLGCVGYWLLTGKTVFEAKTAITVVAKHLSEQPTTPSRRTELSIPDDVDRLIMKLLSKSPDERPKRADALREELFDIARREGWNQTRAGKWWQQHRPSTGKVEFKKRKESFRAAFLADSKTLLETQPDILEIPAGAPTLPVRR